MLPLLLSTRPRPSLRQYCRSLYYANGGGSPPSRVSARAVYSVLLLQHRLSSVIWRRTRRDIFFPASSKSGVGCKITAPRAEEIFSFHILVRWPTACGWWARLSTRPSSTGSGAGPPTWGGNESRPPDGHCSNSPNDDPPNVSTGPDSDQGCAGGGSRTSIFHKISSNTNYIFMINSNFLLITNKVRI